MNRLLLVEDDPDLGNVLSGYLRLQDFEVHLARDGEKGWELFQEILPELCILDIMLPGIDGFELSRRIKNRQPEMPLIFLTAKTLKEDRIKGLLLGADDYICKPFEVEELVLRIKNILRRIHGHDEEVIQIGEFQFRYGEMTLVSVREKIQLTQREGDLLRYLYLNRNRVVEREALLKDLWGEVDYFLGRSLDVFISRLRKYFRDDPQVYIKTMRGKGFCLKLRS